MCLQMALRAYNNIFTRPARKQFRTYIEGLTRELRNFSVRSMADIVQEKYGKLWNFISRGVWDEREMNRRRIHFEKTHSQLKYVNVIVDDTAERKYSSRMWWVDKDYIGNMGKVDTCAKEVFLCFAGAEDATLIDFEYYIRARKLPAGKRGGFFRSKHEIALGLINRACFLAKELGVVIDYVLFDSWYASCNFMNSLHGGGLKYITQLKGDRNVVFNGQKVKAKDLVKVLQKPFQVIKTPQETLLINSVIIDIALLTHQVKAIVVVNEKDEVEVYVSNDLSLAQEQAIWHITGRNKIEQEFRTLKTYLAMDEGKFQKQRCYRRHIYLCLVALTTLRYLLREKYRYRAQTVAQLIRLFRKRIA